MNADPIPDINQTIASAVNARVEAEMLKALSGDDVMARFIANALTQQVEVETRPYHKEPMTYMSSVLRKAIQEAAKTAVQRWVAENLDAIEAEVARALRSQTKEIAGLLTASLAKTAAAGYGVNVGVSLELRGPAS